MTHNPIRKQSILLVLFTVLLTSCTQAATPDLNMARTYAAQTQSALPTATQTEQPPIPTPTPTDAATATPTATVGPIGPDNFPDNVNPLTGLVVEDPTNLDRRPVFVKVANYPPSGRPHAGLSFADMVFEYYIGYGSNRFIAMFYGQDSTQIGPVRSGRLVDPQLVNMYQGILGFEGAYVTILDYIQDILGNRALNGVVGLCPAICDDGRGIVTSVFADSQALTSLADQRGVDNERYDLNGMIFDQNIPQAGEAGQQATVLYANLNRGEWRFDEESGQYLRWIEDTTGEDLEMIPLVDRTTEEQLAFSNVAVIFAYHNEITPSMHDIDIWGNTSGRRAVIFRDGQAYDVNWSAPLNSQPIRFFDEEGNIFPLKPGNTWVVIMGINSGVSEEEGVWTFNFGIP